MKKLPKFMVCHNPLVNDNKYLLHTQNPRFIGQIEQKNGFVITNIELIDNTESDASQYIGSIHYGNGVELQISIPSHKKLELILKRANDWLIAYTKNHKL